MAESLTMSQIATALKDARRKNIDKKSGAPPGVRLSVGAAEGDADKLATGRKFYPDFKQYGEDNFIYTDPKTGRPTVYNPEGFQPLADTISVAPEIGQVVAGGATAALATAARQPQLAPIAYGIGSQLFGTLTDELLSGIGNRVDTRTLPEKYTDQAIGFGTEAIGERLGIMGGDALNRFVKDPIKNTLSNLISPGGAARRELFRSAGINPRAGSVSESESIRLTEQALAGMPGSATIMQNKARQELGEVAEEATNVSEQFTRATNPNATASGDYAPMGARIQDAVKQAGEKIIERKDQLYTRAYNVIPKGAKLDPDDMTSLTQMRNELMEISDQSDFLKSKYAPTIAKIDSITGASPDGDDAAIKALEGGDFASFVAKKKPSKGPPTFEILRQIRTEIGREIDPNPFLMAAGQQTDNVQNKQIYARIKNILDKKASQYKGNDGKTGVELIRKADNYTRRQAQRADIIKRFINKNVPERVVTTLMNEGKVGASVLQGLRRQMEMSGQKEVWDDLAGTILGQLGRPTAMNQSVGEVAKQTADFSAARFLTNFNKLNQSGADKALFSGTRYKNLKKPLERLWKITQLVKGSDDLANRSNTAKSLFAMGFIAASPGLAYNAVTSLSGDKEQSQAGGSMAGMQSISEAPSTEDRIENTIALTVAGAGAVLSPRVTAKLITSPRFVNWLSNYSMASTKKAASKLAARLVTIGKAEPEIKEAINEFRSKIDNEPLRRSPMLRQ